jgi:hypothetical protein
MTSEHINQQTATHALSLKQVLIGQLPNSFHRNPHTDVAASHVETFAREHRILISSYKQTNAIAGFLYPQASLERQIVLSQFMCAAYYLDDVYGDLPTSQGLSIDQPAEKVTGAINACIRAFKGGTLQQADDVLAFTFQKVRHNMLAMSPAWWLERFTPPMIDFFISTINPAAFGWRADGSITAQDYMVMREHISGMYPTVDLIEFAIDGYLPDEVFFNPQIQRLRQACARICSLTNDLFSYHREVMLAGLRLNLIDVIQRNQNLSLTDAVQQAIDLINGETRLFYELAETCSLWDSETNILVSRYIDGLIYQFNATWHWEMNTNRYRSPDSPFVELQQCL